MSDLRRSELTEAEMSCLACLGAIRQDVRSLVAAVARLEEIVQRVAPQVASPVCNCDTPFEPVRAVKSSESGVRILDAPSRFGKTACNCHAKDWER